MKEENRIINSLWVGEELSALELLTINSFMHHGHEFHLWVYQELKTTIPEGVILHDASSIIPANEVFCYKYENEWGHGKGSYAGFSDIFRYKLLYEKGGWWVDMDVTCLKPFDFDSAYFFRSHDVLDMVGNVMKTPKGCSLMKDCYEQASKEITEENTAWFRPIEILNEQIQKHQLVEYIQKGKGNMDRWGAIERLLRFNKINKNWYFIHWLNEEWRSRQIPKDRVGKLSALAFLHQKYATTGIHYVNTHYLLLLMDMLWKDVILLWSNKFINWLKKPGIPVFMKKKIGGHE